MRILIGPPPSSGYFCAHCTFRTSAKKILGGFPISVAGPQAPCKIITIFFHFMQNVLMCIKPFYTPNDICFKKKSGGAPGWLSWLSIRLQLRS